MSVDVFPGICGSEAQLVRAHANDFAIALVERMRVKWSLAGKAGVHARKRRRAAEQGSWEAAQRVEEEVVEDAPGEPGQQGEGYEPCREHDCT